MRIQQRLRSAGIVQLVLLASTFFLPGNVLAALDAYATITGEVQGLIEGDVTITGREGSILVKGFGHNVNMPFDPATGGVSGKIQHRPIRILKNVDPASPRLFQAMVTNEALTDVTIRFWRSSRSGTQVQFYTVQLLNARIVSIAPTHSSVSPDDPPMRETVSLVYETIIITWEDGGISAEDDWAIPPV